MTPGRHTQIRPRTVWATLDALVVAFSLMLLPVGSVPTTGAREPSPALAQTIGETQTNTGGGVTVQVTLQDLPDGPVFTVVLDTHSVDLDGYDLLQIAVLRTADGRELLPRAWNAPPGGHHRQGTLAFPSVGADGNPLIGSGPLELVIRDVAGVPERVFRWEIQG